MKKPPDLQDLVQAYGGYSNIPADAWAAYDRAVAAYESGRRAQLREERDRNRAALWPRRQPAKRRATAR